MTMKRKPYSLKYDLAMKRAFSDRYYPEHMLTLLEIITGKTYHTVEFLDPYNYFNAKKLLVDFQEQRIDRETYFTINDIKAKVDDEDFIIVEVQRQKHPGWMNRMHFYHCVNYVDQYRKGLTNYSGIRPVHVIALTDFDPYPTRTPAVVFGDYYPPGVRNNPYLDIEPFGGTTFFNLNNPYGATPQQLQLQNLFNDRPLIGKDVDKLEMIRARNNGVVVPAQEQELMFDIDRELYGQDFIYREYVDEAVKQHNLWQDEKNLRQEAEGRFQQEKARRQQEKALWQQEKNLLQQQQQTAIQMLAANGLSISMIAKSLGLSKHTVHRYLQQS